MSCVPPNIESLMCPPLPPISKLLHGPCQVMKILPNVDQEQSKGLEESAAHTHQILLRITLPRPGRHRTNTLKRVGCTEIPTDVVQCRCFEYQTPSTLHLFLTKTILFCSGYGYRPHYDAQNDQRKRIVSKTLSRVERFETVLFENAVFLVWTAKTMLSENNDVTTTTPPGCRPLSYD